MPQLAQHLSSLSSNVKHVKLSGTSCAITKFAYFDGTDMLSNELLGVRGSLMGKRTELARNQNEWNIVG